MLSSYYSHENFPLPNLFLMCAQIEDLDTRSNGDILDGYDLYGT